MKRFHWSHGLDGPGLNNIAFDNRGAKSDRYLWDAEGVSKTERNIAI